MACRQISSSAAAVAEKVGVMEAARRPDGPSSRPARIFGFFRSTGPDFDPIALAIAKLKAFLRSSRPRDFESVCELIATALGLFTSDECENHARHCAIASLRRN
jgi:hypothetical protein